MVRVNRVRAIDTGAPQQSPGPHTVHQQSARVFASTNQLSFPQLYNALLAIALIKATQMCVQLPMVMVAMAKTPTRQIKRKSAIRTCICTLYFNVSRRCWYDTNILCKRRYKIPQRVFDTVHKVGKWNCRVLETTCCLQLYYDNILGTNYFKLK